MLLLKELKFNNCIATISVNSEIFNKGILEDMKEISCMKSKFTLYSLALCYNNVCIHFYMVILLS